jgi:hypothetical protein
MANESVAYNVTDECAVLDRIRYLKRAARDLWPVVIMVLSFLVERLVIIHYAMRVDVARLWGWDGRDELSFI